MIWSGLPSSQNWSWSTVKFRLPLVPAEQPQRSAARTHSATKQPGTRMLQGIGVISARKTTGLVQADGAIRQTFSEAALVRPAEPWQALARPRWRSKNFGCCPTVKFSARSTHSQPTAMLTAPRFRARPSCRPLLPQPLRPPRPLRLPLCSATSVQRSFDSEDELDRGTAEAFRRVADPAAVQKVAAHLDLIWRVSEVGNPWLCCAPGAPAGGSTPTHLPPCLPAMQRKRPELCGSCGGTGEKECSWCHGTGARAQQLAGGRDLAGGLTGAPRHALLQRPAARASALCRHRAACRHCRRHDGGGHAVLQRRGLRTVPGVPRRGEWPGPGVAEGPLRALSFVQAEVHPDAAPA